MTGSLGLRDFGTEGIISAWAHVNPHWMFFFGGLFFPFCGIHKASQRFLDVRECILLPASQSALSKFSTQDTDQVGLAV